MRPRDKAIRGPRERDPEPQQDRTTETDSSGSARDASSPGTAADKAERGPREDE